MHPEKRPACVTVIGWAWIAIGVFMLFSTIMSLFAYSMMSVMSRANLEGQQHAPAFIRVLPYLVAFQGAVAIAGLVSGIQFLRLRAWTRQVLEFLSWLLLVSIAGFGIYWEYGWLTTVPAHAPEGFAAVGAVMGLVIVCVYGIPLGVMLKYLRGPAVKEALARGAGGIIGEEAHGRC